MKNASMCKEIFDFIGDGEKTFAEICDALPSYERTHISGALSSMYRRKTLGKKGTFKKRLYVQHGKQVEFAKKSELIVRPYRGNVFAEPLGKRPHFLDTRQNHQEREQLAMLAR